MIDLLHDKLGYMTENGKALFHGVLALAGLAELFTCKSRLRSFLVGACVGWHVVAVHQHLTESKCQKQ